MSLKINRFFSWEEGEIRKSNYFWNRSHNNFLDSNAESQNGSSGWAGTPLRSQYRWPSGICGKWFINGKCSQFQTLFTLFTTRWHWICSLFIKLGSLMKPFQRIFICHILRFEEFWFILFTFRLRHLSTQCNDLCQQKSNEIEQMCWLQFLKSLLLFDQLT